jgi:4-diphosphocytidyl-2-C-methyl-D-erythritol kinase
MSVTETAYAKINLFLDITSKLSDGYHAIRSVMRAVDLCDDVVVDVREGLGSITLTVNTDQIVGGNKGLPPLDGSNNIAYKAAELFYSTVKIPVPPTEIRITKRIPAQAGLGGGSSDAAAVLRALNHIHGLPCSENQLCNIGAKLGSDIPFCIVGNTGITKLCVWHGDKLSDYDGDEFPNDCVYVIIKPHFNCPTGAAYSMYDKKPIHQQHEIKPYYNIFESIYHDPRIYALKNNLLELGAEHAAMSGSGSAVYGVTDTLDTAEYIKENLSPLYGAKNIVICKTIIK